MVALSNVAGHMDLSPHPEHIVLPLLSGLLEWAVSPAAAAQDAFHTVGQHSNISPQRLAIETLCKLCINVSSSNLFQLLYLALSRTIFKTVYLSTNYTNEGLILFKWIVQQF